MENLDNSVKTRLDELAGNFVSTFIKDRKRLPSRIVIRGSYDNERSYVIEKVREGLENRKVSIEVISSVVSLHNPSEFYDIDLDYFLRTSQAKR